MRISDWSSDVCSSDLPRSTPQRAGSTPRSWLFLPVRAAQPPKGKPQADGEEQKRRQPKQRRGAIERRVAAHPVSVTRDEPFADRVGALAGRDLASHLVPHVAGKQRVAVGDRLALTRSEEHTLNSSHQCASRMPFSACKKQKQ